MKGSSCPNCGANLVLWGARQDPRTVDIEGKKWYQFAGYRQYCRKCGTRLRVYGLGYFWGAFFLLAIANGLGAHRAISEVWGYAGLAVYYVGWLALSFGVLVTKVRYVRFPERDR